MILKELAMLKNINNKEVVKYREDVGLFCLPSNYSLMRTDLDKLSRSHSFTHYIKNGESES